MGVLIFFVLVVVNLVRFGWVVLTCLCFVWGGCSCLPRLFCLG